MTKKKLTIQQQTRLTIQNVMLGSELKRNAVIQNDTLKALKH
jgi:hypothetical protein